MFKKKFGYECAGFPTFEELERDDDMDIEVSCSGYGVTKEMEHDLLQEYGMVAEESSDEEDDEDKIVEPEPKCSDTELIALRSQVDEEVRLAAKSEKKFDSVQNYISSLSKEMKAATLDRPDEVDCFEDAMDNVPFTSVLSSDMTHLSQQQSNIDDDNESEPGSISSLKSGEAIDELSDMDPTSRAYRYKMVEKILSDARSHRSYSTTASTIAPSVIKDKIKRNIELKDQRDIRKRCLAKGEANAVTRGRKENKSTVKEYAGWDF